MLKDSQPTYSSPSSYALSISSTLEIDAVLKFVDKNISGFCAYYQTVKDSDRENRISDALVHYFQICKIDQSGGFLPYDFRKNPTQSHSGKETDIGVFVLTKGRKFLPIIEFEAKRFSESSNNKEYVCGGRGGMERFKRGEHSSHLAICGMFGYVQSRTSNEWITKVNDWIQDLSTSSIDTAVDWKDKNEVLVNVFSFPKVDKLSSYNYRKQSKDYISLFHYFIDLN